MSEKINNKDHKEMISERDPTTEDKDYLVWKNVKDKRIFILSHPQNIWIKISDDFS